MIFIAHYPQLHLSLKCQITFAFRNTLRLWLTKCYALLVKSYFLLSKTIRPAMLRKLAAGKDRQHWTDKEYNGNISVSSLHQVSSANDQLWRTTGTTMTMTGTKCLTDGLNINMLAAEPLCCLWHCLTITQASHLKFSICQHSSKWLTNYSHLVQFLPYIHWNMNQLFSVLCRANRIFGHTPNNK